MRRPFTAALASVCLLLLAPGAARASELGDDLHARRARLMERLGTDAMLVLWSAPTARYSLDIDYEYRQDSNLYYLTGLTQDATILVLMPGNVSRREILFVKDRDPVQEHWRGRTLGVEDARARTAIDTVETTSRCAGGRSVTPSKMVPSEKMFWNVKYSSRCGRLTLTRKLGTSRKLLISEANRSVSPIRT